MLTKSLNEEINNKQNKIDRAALRKYFKEKKIAEGKAPKAEPEYPLNIKLPIQTITKTQKELSDEENRILRLMEDVKRSLTPMLPSKSKVRPTSKKGRIVKDDDISKITALTKARTARDPDKEITVLRTMDRESNYPDDLDLDPFTVTKGTTSRDPAKGLDEESQLPNVVGQASDPTSPVIKLDVRADPGLPEKEEQEFFMDRVQDYLDQGDDLKTARKRAGNDLQEKKLSELTVDQLRDKMGRGSVDSPIEMDDIKPSRSIDYGQPRSDTEGLSTLITDKLGDIKGAKYKVTKKKAGGQVGKPKRKIKKQCVAMIL